MSIEALLEAAKYVELTGDPPERQAVPAATSRGNTDSSGETEVKESDIVKQSSSVTALHSSKLQEKDHSVGQEPVVQHVVKTAIDSAQKNLPSVSCKKFILNAEPSQVTTVDNNSFTTQNASTSKDVKEHKSEISQDSQLQGPNVMRHPGYDVRWSYSPPPPPPPPHPSASTRDEPSSSATYSHPPQRSSFLTSPDNTSSMVEDIGGADEGKNLKTGVREVHNKLEKNRRAHLKECFDALKNQIPTLQDRKAKISNSNILSGACRYIGALKRKEKELEHELDRLVRDKIQKQKLLHRLKIETTKSLHLGLSWHREGSIMGQDTSSDGSRSASVTEKSQDREDEDRYSTSTASEAEEEERKSQQYDQATIAATVTSVVTAVASMTTTVTNSAASSCQTVTSTSTMTSLPSGSYRHPLKLHLLREHRAQVEREREAAAATSTADYTQETTGTSIATLSGPGTSSVTIVPNMPISPSARPTVSQLLGKPSVSIRQPVRKQTPCHSVMHPIQRYQAPGQNFIRAHHREIAVRPSSTQPVVTIGVTQAMQSRPDLSPQNVKHSHGQVVPVTPQGLKLPHNQAMDSASNVGHSVAIVSSSLPASFLQAAIPGVSAALTQPLMAPITLSPTPVKQVFLTHQNFTGYASVPSLSSPLLQPFLTVPQTIANPVLTNITQSNSSTPISVFSGSLSRSHPAMALKGPGVPLDSSIHQPLITTGTVSSTFSPNPPVLTPHQIATVSSVAISTSSSQPQPMIAAMTSAVKAASKNGKLAGAHRDKPLITTSQIAQTLLANGGMSKVKTVTAGTPAVTSTSSLGKSLVA